MSPVDEGEQSVPPHDVRQRMDKVVKCFVNGMSIPAIVEYLEREGIKVARDVPYQDLARATARRWISYEPPKEAALCEGLLEKSEKLKDVYVPNYGGSRAVMASGARLCAGAIWNIARQKALGAVAGDRERGIGHHPFMVRVPKAGEENGEFERVPFADLHQVDVPEQVMEPEALEVEIRIGFSGGITMAVTAEELRHALAERVEDWEKELKERVLDAARKEKLKAPQKGVLKRRFKVQIRFFFVNLVSGFDLDPRTNPISFLTEFTRDEALVKRTTVKLFNAMPFVQVGRQDKLIRMLKPLSEVRDLYDRKKLDVILTSGSSIDDPHGLFSRYYENERLRKLLESRGVEGDILWMPLKERQPLAMKKLKEELLRENQVADAELLAFEPMTLLSMEEIQKHVAPDEKTGHMGADVFLILSPCSKCLREKSRIAKAALGQEIPIVTHLVADAETAAATLGRRAPDED